jgi:hypothetical protein
MRLLATIAAAAMFLSCDPVPEDLRSVGVVSAPSSAIGVTFAPPVLTLGPTVLRTCDGVSGLGISPFDLVVVPTNTGRSDLDHVTFRLVDGSSVGGPSVTFPKPQLEQMFGSTALLARRSLRFQPVFACVFPQVPFLLAEVTIVSDTGSFSTMIARAPLQ